ncbi:MAG: DUF624 domain-containing protein [Oscillospiraceae bacterium]|nr:DUF624 domain-containing protein [Oscillospiraceae bacterium]
MFSFLNIEGQFYKTLSKITNYLILGLAWFLACIPIFTVGPACTALYSAHHKVIKNGNGYVWGSFWQQFRANFKQGFLLGLIALVIMLIFGADLYILLVLQGAENMGALTVIFTIMAALAVMWMQYWFPYISHIDDPIKAVLKNTLIMTFAHLPQSILIVLVFGICAVVNIYAPALLLCITLIASPIVYCLCTYRSFVKVFSNYWDMTDGNAELEEKQKAEE